MDADPRNQRLRQLEAENIALCAQVQTQAELIDQLRQQIGELEKKIQELEQTAARQAAPFRRRDKIKKPPEQHKRPGRPPGHPPAFRPPPTQIDETIEVPLDQCPQCGGPLTDVQSCGQYIEDLPPVRPHVTKLTT